MSPSSVLSAGFQTWMSVVSDWRVVRSRTVKTPTEATRVTARTDIQDGTVMNVGRALGQGGGGRCVCVWGGGGGGGGAGVCVCVGGGLGGPALGLTQKAYIVCQRGRWWKWWYMRGVRLLSMKNMVIHIKRH